MINCVFFFLLFWALLKHFLGFLWFLLLFFLGGGLTKAPFWDIFLLFCWGFLSKSKFLDPLRLQSKAPSNSDVYITFKPTDPLEGRRLS